MASSAGPHGTGSTSPALRARRAKTARSRAFSAGISLLMRELRELIVAAGPSGGPDFSRCSSPLNLLLIVQVLARRNGAQDRLNVNLTAGQRAGYAVAHS